MSIKELPENVWSKIAAGEVVERPASAVKELVENSLDADSTKIKVNLTDGGRLKIIVEDDGNGIEFNELPLALTYHATSKISEIEDLENINTLGYRGEALASIAAVADVEIISRQENAENGGLIRTKDGKIVEHIKTNCPKGTRIKIENLFSGLPARRKFLKSASGELRRCAVFLREYAVCNPEISFSLEHDGKEIFTTDGTGDKRRVLAKIWEDGAEIQNVKISAEHLNLECWFQSRAGIQTGRNDVMAFVNGRAVNDPVIKSAVSQAARELSGNWALFFTIETSLVDVNIHPAKSEVRFRYPEEIYKAVHSVVNNLGNPINDSVIPLTRPSVSTRHLPAHGEAESPLSKGRCRFIDREVKTITPPVLRTTSPHTERQTQQIFLDDFQEKNIIEPEINYLGQTSGGYLIYDDGDGIILVDPHAAHERINYEKIKSRAEKFENVQKLLVPVLLHPTLALEVHEFEHELKESGFEFTNTKSGIELNSIPLIGVEFEPVSLLRASLNALKNYHDGDSINILWRTWATMACKASIKLTTKLEPEEALTLWRELNKCEQPTVCPHGRPTNIKITNSKLQRDFGRE